jgi:hypothetical protein
MTTTRDMCAYRALGLVEVLADMATHPTYPQPASYIVERLIERAKDFKAVQQAEALASIPCSDELVEFRSKEFVARAIGLRASVAALADDDDEDVWADEHKGFDASSAQTAAAVELQRGQL